MLAGRESIPNGKIPHILNDLWYLLLYLRSAAPRAHPARESAAGFDDVGQAFEHVVGVADAVHDGKRTTTREVLDQR